MQQTIKPKLGILAALAMASSNIFSGARSPGLALSSGAGGYAKPHKNHKSKVKDRKTKHKKVYAKRTRGY